MEVQVKHLIEVLQKIDPEMPVILDKDGWLIDDIQPKDELDLIMQRGLWSCYSYDDGMFLVINN